MQRTWFSLPATTRAAYRAVAFVLILGAPTGALGQEPFRPSQPVNSLPVVQQDPFLDAASAAPSWYGRGTIRDSVLGPADNPSWTPLHFSNLGDGWTDAWIRPPDGPSGAPRQGLLNAFDGFFTREFHQFYTFTDDRSTGGDKHVGLFQFQTPLSRRLWIGIDAPYVESVQGRGSPNTSRFGDLAITPRVMLTETQDLSLSAGLTVRTPTGIAATESDRLTLTPFVATWKDIGAGVQLRGALGLEVPINRTARNALPGSTLIVNAAVGQTLTPHEATPFGDFTYYVSANLRQDLGSDNARTFLSFTPGIRTHLGRNLFFLAAYEFTVVGPLSFDQRFLVGFVKGF